MKSLFTYAVKTYWFVAIVLVMGSCHSSKTVAIEEGWELLADKKVNFVRDKDDIPVKSRNEFTSLRFRVEERDIHINGLTIYFANGDKLEPNIDDVIKAGESSRLIELGREGRSIDHIEFKYRTTGNVLKGRARVLVLGEKRHRGY